jgi:hypothetical protein
MFVSVFFIAIVNAVDINISPTSGSLTLIENSYPQKITLSFANYAQNESLNVTINASNELTILNSTSYSNLTLATLDVYVASISSNYGARNILFTFSNGIIINYQVQVISLSSPPIITEAKPDQMQSNSIVTLKVVTNKPATCKFDVSDKAYQSMNYLFEQTNSLHVETWQLEDGDYSYYVRCIDNESNVMQISKLIQFRVDTHGPKIVYTSPKFTVNKKTTELVVRTDEDATCRYATSSTEYRFMTTFDVSDKKDHYRTLTNLASGNHIYYVQCVDKYGNYGDITEIVFTVNEPPKAQIQLSTPSPIKSGTIGVTVVISEELKLIPVLSYSLDGNGEIKVPMTGSGNIYTGFMIIDDVNNNQIGEFKIQMIDLQDLAGTEITSGNTFMVQTKILPKIKYLSAVSQENGNIVLRWYLDKDISDVKSYNIYRSEKQDVTNLDFYIKVNETEFNDLSVELQKTYYYRVASVDSAENVGLLSEVVQVTSIDITKKGLTQDQLDKLSKTKVELDAILADISGLTYDISLNNFKKFSSMPEVVTKRIKDQISELDNLKSTSMTNEELDKRLETFNLEAISLKNSVISTINIQKSNQVSVSTSADDVVTMSNEYLVSKRLSDSSKKAMDEYLKQNKNIASDLFVSVYVTNYDTQKFDGISKKYAILSFDVSLSNQHDSELLLDIPKTIAGDVNELNFGVVKFNTINRDPLVAIDVSQKSSYVFDVLIEGEVSETELQNIRVALVMKPTTLINSLDSSSDNGNSITGNIISESMNFIKNNIYVTIGTMIIIGLAAYLFFTGNKKGPNQSQGQSHYRDFSKEGLNPDKVRETENMLAELKEMVKK